MSALRKTSNKNIQGISLLAALSVASLAATGNAEAQSPETPDDLPPVVVEGAPPKAAKKKKAAPSPAAPQTVAPAEAPEPVADVSTAESGGANESAPGLNLSTPGTSGSRLGLTPLETPASVDVISGETARERGQHSVVDAVTRNAPGFSSVAPPHVGSAFAARGFQGNNSVMQLYDGTRLFPGRGNITFPFNMWSVERIEVLHGPASVLYGDGAIGGIINVIPKKPITEGMFNEAQVFFDSNMTRRASLDSGGAISRGLSYRFNVSAEASDGWVDDGESENLGISGALRWQASRDLVFSLSHDYGQQEPMKYFGTPYRDGLTLDKRIRERNFNVSDSFIDFEDSWTQFKTDWRVNDSLSFRNVVYYLDSRREFRNTELYYWDFSGSGLVDRDGSMHIRQKQDQVGNRFDATLRTGFLGVANETVVGFDINRANFGFSEGAFAPSATSVDPFDPDPGLYPGGNTIPRYDSELDQRSLFIEDRLILNEYLTLVGGVRWDTSEISRSDLLSPAGSFDKEFNAFNWRAGAVVTPFKGLAFFGQYAVASDPLNVPLLDMGTLLSNFDLTEGRQAEIGVKQSLWNGRVEWSLAGYDIVKTDLLVFDTSTFATVQVGQQSSRGIEAAIGVELGAGWRVDANGAILRAKYDDFTSIDWATFSVVDYSGNVPLLVPEKTGNVWVSWAFLPNWQASVGLQYVGESFENFANTVKRPSYTVTNFGLQWQPLENATLDFRVKNVFDEVYAAYLREHPDVPGAVQGWIAPPRTFEAALSVRF